MNFATHLVSRPGRRESNQDAARYVLAPEGLGCWIVADGVGGQKGGEVASAIAARILAERFEERPQVSSEALSSWVGEVQAALHERQDEDPALDSMRTTLVVLLADAQNACWGHIGDSRLYAFRDGRLTHQTQGHSVPEALAAAGNITPGEVRRHADRGSLLKALGQAGDPDLEVVEKPVPVRPGDTFLLCSDGFWEAVTELELEADLAKSESPGQWLTLLEDRLLRRLEPDHDNYTMIGVMADA